MEVQIFVDLPTFCRSEVSSTSCLSERGMMSEIETPRGTVTETEIVIGIEGEGELGGAIAQ
jgi:hypothetical protein